MLSPIEQYYVDSINLAMAGGFFALGLIVFLLAVIAVRGLGSR